jgi:polyisoprenoid-binding protein YceI
MKKLNYLFISVLLICLTSLHSCKTNSTDAKDSKSQIDTLVNESGRLLPRKLRGIPFGITAAHTPNPCYAEFENGKYVWKHNTTVLVNQDMQLVEYGSFVYTTKGWYLRVSYTAKDFDEHYGTKEGMLKKDVIYADPTSWRMSDSLFAGDAIWYYIAKDVNGKLYKGIAPIETEGQTLAELERIAGFSKLSNTLSTMQWTGYAEVGDYSLTGSVNLKNGIYKLKNDSLKELELTIDMPSINSDNKDLKTHLCNADFFNVSVFPTSRFVLNQTLDLKVGKGIANGMLTIKDVTKPIAVPFTCTMQAGKPVFEGKLIIDRTTFNIKYGSKSFFDNLGDQAIKNTFDIVFKVKAE